MSSFVRALITSGVVMGGIFALVLAPALDRRGLPGGLFAAVILLLLMLLSARVVLESSRPVDGDGCSPIEHGIAGSRSGSGLGSRDR